MRAGSPAFVLPATVVSAVLAGVAVTSGMPLGNPDTYFHLRVGEELLSGRWSLWNPGHFSPTSTQDWVSTQWLGQVLMAGAERLGGLDGVAWLSALVIVGYLLSLWWTARERAGAPVAAALLLLGYLGSLPYLSARPQVWSYLAVVLTTAAWLRTAEDGRARWWLVPLTWVWAMLHGMWPVAVVLGGAAAVGQVLDHGWARLRLLAVPVASALAAALTPLGPRLYAEMLVVARQREFFHEWGPPDLSSAAAVPALLLLVAVVVAAARRRCSWTHLVLLVVAGFWLAFSLRTQPVAVAVLVPLGAALLGPLLPVEPVHSRWDQRVGAALGALALAGLAIVLPVTDRSPSEDGAALSAALEDVRPGARLVTDWGWGGYVAWARPDVEVTVHGYGDMFTVQELRSNDAIGSLDPGWREDLRALGARQALLQSDERLSEALTHEGWTEVARHDGWVLLQAP